MARIRAIKPQFFLDLDIAQLPFEHRLLFIGLWLLADREGRLVDEPQSIKSALFSSDLSKINRKVNVDELLNRLCEKPFIIRYEAEGKRYIQIVNFSEHQQPHIKELESKIPEPVLNHTSTILAPVSHHTSTSQEPQEGKGREGKGKEGNGVYVDFEKSTCTLWNSFVDKFPSLSKVNQITETRRKHLKQRFTEQAFKDFSLILTAIEEQPFLVNGNPDSDEHKNWRIDFDWLIKNDQNYVKVLERKYKDKQPPIAEGLKKYLTKERVF